MSRDDQFTAVFVLIANLWLIAATLATNTHSKTICALAGIGWIIGLLLVVLA